MKEAGNSNPRLGGITQVTEPGTSAVLNVDEYASASNHAGTGFPKQGGQSLSYWLQQVRCDPLLDHRTTSDLPQEADTVIIGSGITGTLVAKHHHQTFPSKTILVLEAREFCSGATGRNAGHCKPDQWRHYTKFEKAFGSEQSVKIMQNERATWEALVEYVRRNKVDCDLWVGDTIDVPLDDGVAKIAEDVFEDYKNAGGKVDHIKVIREPIEAAKFSRFKNAKACYAWSASTLQPWKLTAHIMRENLKQGINLQTYTTAEAVEETPAGPRKFVIRTNRGEVACDTVVYASNAYTAAIDPSFKGIITPKPHMCNKVVPPRSWSGSKALQNSYGVLLPNGALFSINPRCTVDGAVMFGGSNPGQKALDEWVEKHPEHGTNDGFASLESVTKYVRAFVEEEFEGWKETKVGPGEGFEYSWSGIIGLSADGVPFIGEIPGKPGQWICAGHHGHGMARTFTAAPSLVKLMSGEPWAATGLPDVYQLTAERLERLKGGDSGPRVVTVKAGTGI